MGQLFSARPASSIVAVIEPGSGKQWDGKGKGGDIADMIARDGLVREVLLVLLLISKNHSHGYVE